MTKAKTLLTLLIAVIFVIGCGQQTAEKQQPIEEETAEQAATETEADESYRETTKFAEAQPTEQKKQVTKTKTEPKVEEKIVPPAPKVVTVSENSVIQVVLIDSIDTDIHVTGQEFRAELLEPIVVNGEVAFPKGARAVGVLNKVVESGRMKTPAELTFSLVSIANRDGQQVMIDTHPIEEKKDSHTKKQVGLIGGGAVVGGVIGKLTGKKGGTEIGAAAGAAAGAATAAATGKQDIVLHEGTQVNFVLRRPIEVNVTTSGPVAGN